ncbi:PulJ/GspJ family protein [Tessaracoccus sp.]
MGRVRRAHAFAVSGGGQGGFTLMELLVAISIFSVLGATVLSGLIATAKTVDDVRSITNLTEEARVSTERMSRELRQASAILDAHLPASATDYTSVTFGVDFNGDHILQVNAADPEIVTYRFDPGSGQLTLTANDLSGAAVTRPILAANVTSFALVFTSSLWEYDTNGNGVTDWTEIDASALGNHNAIFDAGEFDRIDSVGLTLQLLDGSRAQTYTTQVDLRNRNQN